MEPIEFVMSTELETALPPALTFNFEQLKGQISQLLERYRGLVIQEDGIQGAKKDRTDLSRLREKLNEERIRIKKQYLAPYEAFEKQVKEIVALVDEPLKAIDEQLAAFEERRREEKRAAVEAFYERAVGDLREILPLDRLWQKEWYNVGTSMKKIQTSIQTSLARVRADLQVLDTVEGEYAEVVKLKYLETLDVGEALAERSRLKEQTERLRARENERRMANAHGHLPEQGAPPTGGGETRLTGGGGVTPERAETSERAEPRYRFGFGVQVTIGQAARLKEFFIREGIRFWKVSLPNEQE